MLGTMTLCPMSRTRLLMKVRCLRLLTAVCLTAMMRAAPSANSSQNASSSGGASRCRTRAPISLGWCSASQMVTTVPPAVRTMPGDSGHGGSGRLKTLASWALVVRRRRRSPLGPRM
ncbi:hypothetical protein DSECCO2_494560 [anaerobic digester metagenome]